MKRFAMVLVLATLATAPVRAEGASHSCGLFCKVWRNVSGKVQTPVSTESWDDGGMRAPTPEEEARQPRTADLVTVHGDIIRESRAEQMREHAEATAQIKRIEALRNDGGSAAEGRLVPHSDKAHAAN